MSALLPIVALDVSKEGQPCAISATPPKDGWRWYHLDMADPALPAWLETQVEPLVASALLAAETRPRVDRHGAGLVATLRGVNLNPDAEPEDMVSLRMWITGDRIISVRKRRLMALDSIRQRAQDGNAPATVGAFLADLTEGLSQRIETVTLECENSVDDLEERSLTGDAEVSHTCLALRQSVIKLRRFVGPQREALIELANQGEAVFGAEHCGHIREAANRTARSVEALDSLRDRLAAIQEHIDAQTAMALGRNSYILSVMAAIFLPLGFLTGLFGVNVAGMPGTETLWAFGALCVLSVAIGLALYLAFRWRRWL